MAGGEHWHHDQLVACSTQAVRAQSGANGDRAVRDLILATTGIDRPSEDQVRIARLVVQATFGVLTSTVGGELDADQAVADVRLACRSLIGHGFGAASD